MDIMPSEKLIDNLSQKLKTRKLFMCTAESCTGGLIAATCTSRAGSSEWFNGGIVSYSNEMKMSILGVPEVILEEYGAVSLPVVEQMTRGALRVCAAQAAIAVSGVAGPGGGSKEKPVGTVCLSVSLQTVDMKEPRIVSLTEHFNGSREAVRQQAVLRGLEMLDELLNRT